MKRLIPTIAVAAMTACSAPGTAGVVEVALVLSGVTKAAEPPPEDRITDVNLFVYNSRGVLEEHRYLRKTPPPYPLKLLSGATYSVYACVNLGYDIGALSLRELLGTRYSLAYPDEYSEGFPMTGAITDVTPTPGTRILSLPLERMMSQLTLSIDRTALDADVGFAVEEIRIGGCPRSALLFGQSGARSQDDLFALGYCLEGDEAAPLNRQAAEGKSGKVSLYQLENCQGEALEGLLSFIEIKAHYHSSEYRTKPGEYLIYRFYPGAPADNYSLRRNCRYDITVKPEGSGLTGDSWRVDISGLEENYNPSVSSTQATIIARSSSDARSMELKQTKR